MISENYGEFGMYLEKKKKQKQRENEVQPENVEHQMKNKTRFADPVNDTEVKELIESQENKNTIQNMTWTAGVFRNWRRERNVHPPSIFQN